MPQRPDVWSTASGATIAPYAQGHLCFRTLKVSSCPQKPAMCMSSSLELLVECPFRDTPEFPVCFCSSQLPITPSKRSYSPIPESTTPSLFCSLQSFYHRILYLSSWFSQPHNKIHEGKDLVYFVYSYIPTCFP